METFSAIVGTGVGLTILWLIRKDKLVVRYGAIWMLVAAGFIGAGLFTRTIDVVAAYIGLAYPPLLAIICLQIFLTIKALLADIALSEAEVRLVRLTQEVAMLEHKVALDRDKKASL